MCFLHKDELIKFWKSPASGSGSIRFLKDSLPLRDIRAFFHNLAHISDKNWLDLHDIWYFVEKWLTLIAILQTLIIKLMLDVVLCISILYEWFPC